MKLATVNDAVTFNIIISCSQFCHSISCYFISFENIYLNVLLAQFIFAEEYILPACDAGQI